MHRRLGTELMGKWRNRDRLCVACFSLLGPVSLGAIIACWVGFKKSSWLDKKAKW
jgi:hypothetical protein